MSQDLIEKIRAAAQAKGVDPDLAVRIATAESGLKPGAGAKTSTAGGLFGVIDSTWKGFGGKPGMKHDPDENIRVGTDVIAKNTEHLKGFLKRDPRPAEVYAAHFFGPSGAKAFLTADPSTPMESLFSESVIKANPQLKGKTSGQVMASLEGKVGAKPAVSRETEKVPTPPARAAGEPRMAQAPGDVPRETQLASLGPSYQAALALSFLADNDETRGEKDIDNEPSVAEQWLAQVAPKPALSMADISVKSPFPVEQPIMMADGGDVGGAGETVQQLAEGSTPVVRLADGGDAGEKAAPQVTGVNKVLDFIAQRLDPKMFPTSARTLLETVQGTKTPITESHFSPEELDVMRQLATLKGGDKGSVNYGDYLTLAQEMRKKGNMAASATPSMFSMADPLGNVQTTLGRFSYQKDPQGNVQIVDKYDFNPPNPNLMQEARTGDYGGFGPYGLIRDYAGEKIPPGYGREVRINLPAVKRADGSPETGELGPATVNPMIRRQGEAARRLAAMRDVNTLPDPRTYSAVSGFLGTPPDEQGFSALHPDIQGIKKAGEAGFYAGTAAQVAPIAGQAAKMLGKLTGSALNERLLAGQSLTPGINTPAPINFAVKPRGGTVLHTYTGQDGPLPISKLDELIMEYRMTAARDHDADNAVVDFIRQKAPRYFTTVYGTADDPLRTAIRGRAIEPFGRDAEKIPPYLVDAAKFPQARGHLRAKQELERMYDEMTGVNPWVLKPEDQVVPGSMEQRRMINQKMAQEGVPVEAQNAPPVDAYTRGEFEDYPSSTKLLRQLVQNEGQLPPNIQHAMRTGEPMYDISPRFDLLTPSNVVDALKQVPPDKLKSMSFPEALIQGTQALAPIRDYRAAIDMADRGAKIPPTVLQQFTKPVAEAPGGTWVQITDPVATELEGKMMKHSVGGYGRGDSYGTGYTGLPYGGKLAFDDGLVRVFSLRDKAGEPTITVEMARPKGQEGWNVTQVRGRFNSEPMDKQSVFNLFDKIDSTEGLGKIKPNSYSRSATGADVEGSQVDWGTEYDLWKQSAE